MGLATEFIRRVEDGCTIWEWYAQGIHLWNFTKEDDALLKHYDASLETQFHCEIDLIDFDFNDHEVLKEIADSGTPWTVVKVSKDDWRVIFGFADVGAATSLKLRFG